MGRHIRIAMVGDISHSILFIQSHSNLWDPIQEDVKSSSNLYRWWWNSFESHQISIYHHQNFIFIILKSHEHPKKSLPLIKSPYIILNLMKIPWSYLNLNEFPMNHCRSLRALLPPAQDCGRSTTSLERPIVPAKQHMGDLGRIWGEYRVYIGYYRRKFGS